MRGRSLFPLYAREQNTSQVDNYQGDQVRVTVCPGRLLTFVLLAIEIHLTDTRLVERG